MPYTITDKHHKLIIRLNTFLQFNDAQNIYLDVYRENINSPTSFVPTVTSNDDGSSLLTFEVRFNQFNIGDVLTRFVVGITGSKNIFELHEGITILVDGNESNVQRVENDANTITYSNNKPVTVNPVTTNRFGITFPDNNPHTVQAIYKGNNEIGVAVSDKITVVPAQTDENAGAVYKLTCKMPSSMKYMGNVDWAFTLTKNGSPVPNELVQVYHPTGTYTHTTNSKGQIKQGLPDLNILSRWEVGTYSIIGRAFFYRTEQDQEIVVQCKKTLKITKNTPTLTYTPSSGKGGHIKFQLKDPRNRPLANKKIIVTINKKNTSKNTDKNGIIKFKTNTKGTIKGKATYAGDNNYNKVTTNFNQVIR